jgi:hypothetical protein
VSLGTPLQRGWSSLAIAGRLQATAALCRLVEPQGALGLWSIWLQGLHAAGTWSVSVLEAEVPVPAGGVFSVTVLPAPVDAFRSDAAGYGTGYHYADGCGAGVPAGTAVANTLLSVRCPLRCFLSCPSTMNPFMAPYDASIRTHASARMPPST